MRHKAVLYHDGCEICLSVVEKMTRVFDNQNYELIVFNIERHREYTGLAEANGVKVIPSLVVEGAVIEMLPHSQIRKFRSKA